MIVTKQLNGDYRNIKEETIKDRTDSKTLRRVGWNYRRANFVINIKIVFIIIAGFNMLGQTNVLEYTQSLRLF